MAARTRGQVRTTPKRAMLVAQRIVDEIEGGGLEPGDGLQHEQELIDRYGVSRGTLREALRFLEFQGILTIKTGTHGGPFVSHAGAQGLRPILAMFLQIGRATYGDLLAARTFIDPMLARAAAEAVTEDQLAELARCLEAARTEINNWTEFQRQSDRFHHLVTEATANPIFTVVMEALDWVPIAEALDFEFPMTVEEAALAEHEAIFEAISSGNGDKAEAIMRSHMQKLLDLGRSEYPEAMSRRIRWDIMQ